MDNALASIRHLKGVHEACTYHQQTIVQSTFPATQENVLLPVLQQIEHIFLAAEAVGKSYDELYLVLGDGMFVAYWLQSSHIVLLLTDQRINLPLIHMGVKSAANKLLSSREPETATPPAPEPAPAIPVPPPPPPTSPIPTAPDPNLQPRLDALQKLLIHHLGPAARWVFSDALSHWQQRYSPTNQQLPQLLALLLPEFETEAERQAFQQQAQTLIQ
ncbi:MAG: hypothetical protein PHE17_14450 [Thiothrix sp.]|uniref:hypothetical protein n=1 Tax=Thiothrix sp. TaxID=1032 RepID=UPI0026138D3E|nr:hypothetical protein [Thiothrix sp.]MDD5394210.1 hypothetical protein [Thiothrix sp.]